jgi:hypothetical protein
MMRRPDIDFKVFRNAWKRFNVGNETIARAWVLTTSDLRQMRIFLEVSRCELLPIVYKQDAFVILCQPDIEIQVVFDLSYRKSNIACTENVIQLRVDHSFMTPYPKAKV